MELKPQYKTRIGKGGKTVFDPVIYTCSNKKCKQGIMANGFGLNECPKCGEITNVIQPKNQR